MAQVQICRGFGHKDWEALSVRLTKDGIVQPDESAWRHAIKVFDRRMNERFFSCITSLEKADPRLKLPDVPDDPNPDRPLPADQLITPGFAIMGLCCLLVETLTLFLSLQGNDRERFIAFLQLPSFEGSFSDPELTQAFWDGIRNGIIHQAETRKWLIWRDKPKGQMVEKRSELFILNRALFLGALRKEYESYLGVLRSQQELALKTTFVKRMNLTVKRITELPH